MTFLPDTLLKLILQQCDMGMDLDLLNAGLSHSGDDEFIITSRHAEVCQLWNRLLPYSEYFDLRDVLMVWPDLQCEQFTLPSASKRAMDRCARKAWILQVSTMLFCRRHRTKQLLSYSSEATNYSPQDMYDQLRLENCDFLPKENWTEDRWCIPWDSRVFGYTHNFLARTFESDCSFDDDEESAIAVCGFRSPDVIGLQRMRERDSRPNPDPVNAVVQQLYTSEFLGPVLLMKFDHKMQLQDWKEQDSGTISILLDRGRLWMHACRDTVCYSYEERYQHTPTVFYPHM